MAVPTDITAGTLTITNGSTAVTGSGTAWLASDLRQGDIILWIEGGDGFQTPILAGVPASNSALTLAEPWPGPTLTNVRYRIRYQWDSSRVSAQSRQLIEVLDNGNILALASLTGPGVPVFDGPHSMVIKPEADFINGVAYDVQVDTLADRAAYDGQTEGFSVLVSDVGDGRSALYSKNSNTSGDWSDPAYVTGPIGPTPDIEATVTNTAPGTAPTVTPVPITGGTRLDFTLPEAEGFNNTGPYNPANAYVRNDVVTSNGSTFIALQAVPPGTAPSGATPPVDTAFWQVLAVRGTNGTGTGDVVGPASSVDNEFALFSGVTGKLIKSAGLTLSNILSGMFRDPTDSTKRAHFNLTYITAGQDREIILPDRNLDLRRGGYEKVSEVNLTSAGTVMDVLGLTTAFDTYMLDLSAIRPATTGSSLYCYVSTNGGSSFVTSGYTWGRTQYTFQTTPAVGYLGGTSVNFIEIANSISSTTADGGFNGQLFFKKAALSAGNIVWDGTWRTNGGSGAKCEGGLTTANTVDALRFAMSAGNMVGKISCYGLRT